MKQIHLVIILVMITSCHSYQSMNIPQGERYVILCTDSFDIYYDINTLIYYCEEMKNPQSPLYNEWYAKTPHENVMFLKNIDDDIKMKMSGSLPSFDSTKSKDYIKRAFDALINVKDTEFLFYKYKNVLIKNHYDNSIINDYNTSIIETSIGDFVEIHDKKTMRLLYEFEWLYWWGKVTKKKFKSNR